MANMTFGVNLIPNNNTQQRTLGNSENKWDINANTITATTINGNAATTSTAGLMSAADKTKLDGIENGAQVNTVTGVKGNEESVYRTGNINLTPANIGAKTVQTAVNDPTANGTTIAFIDSISQNTQGVITPTKKTVSNASQSAAGLMSATDKTKLDGIATGAAVTSVNNQTGAVSITPVNIGAVNMSDVRYVGTISYDVVTPGYTNGGEQFFKAALKYIAEHFDNAGMFVGRMAPNSRGPFIGNIYDVNDRDNSTGLPKHSTFIFHNHSDCVESFGTSNYTFYYKKYFNSDDAIPVTNGGTGARNEAAALTNLGAVSRSGDTMTGNLYISKSGGENTFQLDHTSTGVKMSLYNESDGPHGLYSNGYFNGSAFVSSGKWLIYRNAAGKVTVADHYNKDEVKKHYTVQSSADLTISQLPQACLISTYGSTSGSLTMFSVVGYGATDIRNKVTQINGNNEITVTPLDNAFGVVLHNGTVTTITVSVMDLS